MLSPLCSTLYSLFMQEMGDSIFAYDSLEKVSLKIAATVPLKSIKEVVLQQMGQETGCI